MLPWILAGFFAILAVAFPFVSYVLRPKMKAAEKEEPSTAELKASMIFLHTALPTLLFLLGAFGFSSYAVIIDRVTSRVTESVFKIIEKEKIVAWTKEIENYHGEARRNAESLDSLVTVAKDTISSIAMESFLKLLPRGTIIPYSGKISAIDKSYWAICDGGNETPDLRNRFILGSTFWELGRKGGARTHAHQASFKVEAQVTKFNPLMYPHFDGQGTKYEVERHEHAFKASRQTISTTQSENMPPYYRLVFLMKIK